ncbi:MAG: PAS domain-containing protein [Steroidobacteraceae bacterium]
MGSAGPFWKQRLWPALVLPTAVAAGVIALTVLLATRYLAERNLNLYRVQVSDMALDLLANAAESYPLRGNLERMVSLVGTEDLVESLVIATGSPRMVVASTRLQEIGRPLAELEDAVLRSHMLEHATGPRGSVPRMKNLGRGGQTYVHDVELRLGDRPKHHSVVEGEIGLRLAAGELARLPSILVLSVTAAAAAGLLAAMLALTWIMRRRILRPIGSIIEAASRRGTGDKSARVTAPYPDEFSIVARTLNSAFDALEEHRRELVKLAVIADFTSNIVAVTRADETLEWANDAFAKCFGYEPAELANRRLRDVLHRPSTDRQGLDRFWRSVLEQKKISSGAEIFLSRDGREVEVEWEGRPLLDDSGEVANVVIIGRDLTESRAMQRDVNSAMLSVREEVAYTLHDILGGDLGGLAFRLKLLGEQLQRDGRAEAVALQEILEMVNDVSSRARGLSHLMAPVSPVLGGLEPGLKRLCESASRAYPKLDCTLSFSAAQIAVENWQAAHVYLIVQEGIQNAVRHGTPGLIRVTVRPVGDRLRVQVTSDGSVWNPESAHLGVGLRSMRYRASLMNAALSVRARGGITSIRCMVPLRTRASSPAVESAINTGKGSPDTRLCASGS